jgi:broad specificity phosphatase PhoE
MRTSYPYQAAFVKLPRMKTIYLARHGKVENPTRIFYTADFPLGNQGTHQAQALAKDILDAGCNPVRIVASTYLRTRETAEIIAQTLGSREVETDERLIEWQVGDWFGKPLDAFRVAAGYDQTPFQLKLKDIEQFEELSTRVIAALHHLLDSIDENTCAVAVSHREPMVSAILKLQHVTDWSSIPLLDFPPGCCWKLEFNGHELISAEKIFDRSSVI